MDTIDIVIIPVDKSVHMPFNLAVMNLRLRINVFENQGDLIALPVLSHILNIHLLWENVLDQIYQYGDIIHHDRWFHLLISPMITHSDGGYMQGNYSLFSKLAFHTTSSNHVLETCGDKTMIF